MTNVGAIIEVTLLVGRSKVDDALVYQLALRPILPSKTIECPINARVLFMFNAIIKEHRERIFQGVTEVCVGLKQLISVHYCVSIRDGESAGVSSRRGVACRRGGGCRGGSGCRRLRDRGPSKLKY